MDDFKLEKRVWTEADFDIMGWHDCTIYAVAFLSQFELAFDIDYIFQWVQPQGEETNFSFCVSQATLVFENVYDFDAVLHFHSSRIKIDAIKRESPSRPRNAEYIGKETEWEWTIDCQQGDISFHSVGYNLFARAEPVLIASQTLDENTRNISFDRNSST